MKFFRISNLFFFAVATAFAVLLFWTSQLVQQKEMRLSSLHKELSHEKETIRVLSVEWDYLTRPQRLQQLASEYLLMESPRLDEVVKSASVIPEPSSPDPDSDLFSRDFVERASTGEIVNSKEQPLPKILSPSKAEKQSFETLIDKIAREEE